MKSKRFSNENIERFLIILLERPDSEGNKNTGDERICHHCTSRWETNTRKLLGSIQVI